MIDSHLVKEQTLNEMQGSNLPGANPIRETTRNNSDIALTVSIFAHIALDSELQGRYGVQGNTFQNTFGYLNQYLKTQPIEQPKIQSLTKDLEGLVEREAYVKALYINATLYNFFDTIATFFELSSIIPEIIQSIFTKLYAFFCWIYPKTVDNFSKKAAAEINLLNGEHKLLLPGGWIGTDSPGHAMIYQFEKNEEGEIIFSIYNSGAGLNEHQRTSSTEKELYSPVQQYLLPNPVDKVQLKLLIDTLIKPLLPSNKSSNPSDSKMLYKEINRSLVFLDAHPLVLELTDPQKVTGSQLSGTCAQRSIHQMLKLNFATLAEYQKFIFNFKMHAVKEFIKTHPAPRSKQITGLIEKAVLNNLKILQEDNVFECLEEKEKAFQEIEAISLQLLSDEVLKESAFCFSYEWFLSLYQSFLNLFISTSLAQKIEVFNANQSDIIAADNVTFQNINENQVIESLRQVISICQKQKELYPLWVINQIEQVILQLPIPKLALSVTYNAPSFDTINFYNNISTASEIEDFNQKLDDLYDLYIESFNDYLEESILPTQVITHCSFTALRAYFAQKHAAITGLNSFQLYLHRSLSDYLEHYQQKAFLATNNPNYDKRLEELFLLVIDETKKETCILRPICNYQEIINSEPELKNELILRHEKTFFKKFNDENLNALYHALSCYNKKGELKYFSSLNSAKFLPLVKKLKQRKLYEKAFKHYLSPLRKKPTEYYYGKEFKYGRKEDNIGFTQHFDTITNNEKLNSYVVSKYLKINAIDTLLHQSSINNHKYNIQMSPAQRVLYATNFKDNFKLNPLNQIIRQALQKAKSDRAIVEDRLSSNGVQLSPNYSRTDKSLDEREYFARDLFHIRRSPSHQIKLTIEYFSRSSSMVHLFERANQLYVEANIFDPILLLNEIKNNQNFYDQFSDFIAKGLAFFKESDGSLSQESLFFIKLRIEMSRYIAMSHLSSHQLSDYKVEYQRLRQLIIVENNSYVLASLHAFCFFHAVTLLTLDDENDNALIVQAMHSFFYYKANSNPYLQEDTSTIFEMARASIYYKNYLEKTDVSIIKSVIEKISNELEMSLQGLQLEVNYPKFIYRNNQRNVVVSYNIEQGKIFKDNYSLSSIPLYIKNHQGLSLLDLNNEPSCWLSEDENNILLKNKSVRLKRKDKNLFIQKKWALSGDNLAWHELCLLSDKQKKYYVLPNNPVALNKIPEILKDSSVQAWVNSQETLLIRNNKPIYQIDKWGYIHQVDQQGKKNGCILSSLPPKQEKRVRQFEKLDFVKVNLDDNDCGTIDFSRYGFYLEINNNSVYIPKTDYELGDNKLFNNNIASLYFSDGVEGRCFIPVQRFYINHAIEKVEGEFYSLAHDIKNHIYTTLKCEKLHTKDETKLPIQNHHDTQKYITLDQDGQTFIPRSAADALYLTYCYLAINDTKTAISLLNRLNVHYALNGSDDELKYISWIINDLPTILKPDTEEDCKFETPEYIVCQLKALFFYVEYCNFLGQNKQHLSRPSKGADVFLKALPSKSGYLYSLYQRMKRHLDENFIIPDNQILVLLDNISQSHEQENENYIGSMRYEQRRLQLSLLIKEFKMLESISFHYAALPNHYTNRMAELTKLIEEKVEIFKVSSQFEWDTINLSLPIKMQSISKTNNYQNNYKIPFEFSKEKLSNQSKCIIYDWHQKGIFHSHVDFKKALSALSSEISSKDFIFYFSTYLRIACFGSSDQKNIIENFSKNYLIGASYCASTMERKNIKYFSNILYRAVHNSMALIINEKYSLSRLVEIVSELDVPPLKVCKSRNAYEQTLITNPELVAALKETILVKRHLPALIAHYPTPLWQVLKMTQTCEKYVKVEKTYFDNIALIDSEAKAGNEKFNCLIKQREIANALFSQEEVVSSLKNSTQVLEASQIESLQTVWQKIITTINKKPRDKYRVLARQTHNLSESELYKLYLHGNLSEFMQQTSLDESDCISLYNHIHQYVSLNVQYQQVKRLLNAIKQSEPNLIASTLMSENSIEAQIDASLMLFQYQENLLIRPRQMLAITSLLSTPNQPFNYNNVIEKVIMGGGKSKVILPLIAAKKATGTNWLIIEVPRPLIETNHHDLNATSQKIFNQRAHKFEFNRDSDCSVKQLEKLFHLFVNIMINKEYLVTTGESMQSLELKYLDLLLTGPSSAQGKEQGHKLWQQQVFWLSQITGLIKNRADVVIDEVHQGLLLKKKLNYTLGNKSAISKELITHSIELYSFANHLETQGHQFTLSALINSNNSPLIKVLKQLRNNNEKVDVLNIVRNYLNDEAIDEIIINASPKIKDCLAFYKEQLTLYPLTQSRHYKEHYGPSECQSTALEMALAIPYFASNKPNERSRFGNTLETLNYTIQSLLTEGISLEILQEVICSWQQEGYQELHSSLDPSITFSNTQIALSINKLLEGTGFHLGSINFRAPNSKELLAQLLVKVQFDKPFIYQVLQYKILPQVMTDEAVLHSDAYNHVNLYRSVQGVSGTPDNHVYYHQKLHYNPTTSIGTDGFIKAILRSKNTKVNQVNLSDGKEYIEQLFKLNINTRVLIDVSATFAGSKNSVVASIISKLTHQLSGDIKFILYFNDADVLCALDKKTKETIKLNCSDPNIIDKKLKCTPEQRFTYYDQSHTVGTDLKQASHSHALVLADSRTHSQSFLQGAMRMRGLEENQSISIVVPEGLPDSLEDLLKLMEANQDKQLKEDCFFAALAKMEDIIRHDFLLKISALPHKEAKKKRAFALAFRNYFLDIKPESIFDEYGNIRLQQSVKELLNDLEVKLITDWCNSLHQIDVIPSKDEVSNIKNDLKAVIEQSIPLCHKVVKSKSLKDKSLGTAVEKETMKQTEKEVLKETASFESSVTEMEHMPWQHNVYYDQKNNKIISQTSYWMHPINLSIDNCRLFSKHLTISYNYRHVFLKQDKLLGSSTKPIFAILFHLEKNTEECLIMKCTVKACLIDQDDLKDLSDLFKKYNDCPGYWISTTKHNVLEGKMPDGILENKSYLSLIEQINFFNGDLNSIIQSPNASCWLNFDTNKKLAFFKNNLMPYRQTKQSELNSMQSYLEKLTIKNNTYIGHYASGLFYVKNHCKSDKSIVNPPVSTLMTETLIPPSL